MYMGGQDKNSTGLGSLSIQSLAPSIIVIVPLRVRHASFRTL